MNKIIYKKCPNKDCNTIQGFSLTEQLIKKNMKYLCTNCGKETELSKYKESTLREYNKQNKLRRYSEFYK